MSVFPVRAWRVVPVAAPLGLAHKVTRRRSYRLRRRPPSRQVDAARTVAGGAATAAAARSASTAGDREVEITYVIIRKGAGASSQRPVLP
ncbi:hypothetical protein GCM10010166_33400 [Couchioplanes caeruleus subsp. azureus]|nr:hypothetical protein GCM10010166_33400 [Couchioplanes caeruleus subsp. azureus]